MTVRDYWRGLTWDDPAAARDEDGAPSWLLMRMWMLHFLNPARTPTEAFAVLVARSGELQVAHAL
jgi:hypothetical protein